MLKIVGNRFFVVFLTLCCAVSFLMGCSDVKGVDPVIKIGLVAPFEGNNRHIGYDVIYSARLAVREINEKGGIRGYRVSLTTFNDYQQSAEALRVAEALIIDASVVAVFGNWDAMINQAVGARYRQAGLAYIPMGEGGFGSADPNELSADFRTAYQAITYHETQPPGIYAGTAYDAMQLIFRAVDAAILTSGKPTRSAMFEALPQVKVISIVPSHTEWVQLAP